MYNTPGIIVNIAVASNIIMNTSAAPWQQHSQSSQRDHDFQLHHHHHHILSNIDNSLRIFTTTKPSASRRIGGTSSRACYASFPRQHPARTLSLSSVKKMPFPCEPLSGLTISHFSSCFLL
eukprot:764752-Hanusia_phi.AAC.3